MSSILLTVFSFLFIPTFASADILPVDLAQHDWMIHVFRDGEGVRFSKCRAYLGDSGRVPYECSPLGGGKPVFLAKLQQKFGQKMRTLARHKDPELIVSIGGGAVSASAVMIAAMLGFVTVPPLMATAACISLVGSFALVFHQARLFASADTRYQWERIQEINEYLDRDQLVDLVLQSDAKVTIHEISKILDTQIRILEKNYQPES